MNRWHLAAGSLAIAGSTSLFLSFYGFSVGVLGTWWSFPVLMHSILFYGCAIGAAVRGAS